MNKQSRSTLYRKVREALKYDAPDVHLKELLELLPTDSEKAKFFRVKLTIKLKR